MSKLALFGGKPQINYKLPDIYSNSGRDIGDEEKKEVIEVIESGSLGYLPGKKVKQFQNEWAEKFNINSAVATSSGTAALHTAMIFINVGPGDEVLVPAITDMGTVIAILLQNATPVFLDVDLNTQNIDPSDIERKITERTKAIIPVHLFGYPCDMDRIMEIAKKNNLLVVEDCCQAHLTKYKNKIVGTIGDVGCFSFQQTKHITTGDGGMVITNNDCLCGRELQLCADKGWPRDKYREHYFLAPNYHMTDLQAAVGVAQLRKIDGFINNRRKSAIAVSKIIKDIDGVVVPYEKNGNLNTYFAYSFTINPDKFTTDNEGLAKAINAEGVGIIPSYLPKPLYLYDPLIKGETYNNTKCPFSCRSFPTESKYEDNLCPVAEQACRCGMFYLWSEKINEEQGTDIGKAIKKVLAYYKK
jgi:perosamine synthetase